MGFHLADRRHNITGGNKRLIFLFIKIGNADCSYLSCPIGLLHGFIHFQSGIIRLMNQKQINIIRLQCLQRFFDCGLCFFVGNAGTVQLCCKKDLFSLQTAFFYRLPDDIFIFIHLPCVNQPVSAVQCGENRFLACLSTHIPCTKANHRQLHAII